ncbi:MAG: hypothetical protein KKI06_09660, partial [Euryarchaeota archaeon]|nr:hypothetical protein [Euryarchaeota archaeon]
MSTEASFDHLDVINSVLSLAFNLESYPNHLYKAGYHISRIEPQFNVNGTLNPDIFFISDERGLFCECKSHELKDYLSNREDAWTIEINEHWKSRKKLSDDCNLLMRNLSQKILFDYGFEEEN